MADPENQLGGPVVCGDGHQRPLEESWEVSYIFEIISKISRSMCVKILDQEQHLYRFLSPSIHPYFHPFIHAQPTTP